jgi:hypothetical protein
MRQSLWSVGFVGLLLGGLAMVGGTTIGGALGQLAAGYGLLIAFTALYLIVGLVVRDRTWQRVSQRLRAADRADRLAGRRVF